MSCVLSGGIDISKLSVFIMIPMNVKHVVGPMSLSSAIGTPRELKVDLKVLRSTSA